MHGVHACGKNNVAAKLSFQVRYSSLVNTRSKYAFSYRVFSWRNLKIDAKMLYRVGNSQYFTEKR